MSCIYILENHGTHLLCSSDSLMARAAAAEAAVTAPAVRHHLAPSWPSWPPWPRPPELLRPRVRGAWQLWGPSRLAAVWLDLVTTLFQRFIVILV